VKYAFIKDHREEFPIDIMCEILEVSSSGYYDWMKRDHTAKEARKNVLVEKISQIHDGSRRSYGSPRVFEVLKGMGEKISRPTVERLMRDNEIKARSKRRFKVTTDSKHDLPIAKNVLNRQFEVGSANKSWASDITYVWTDEGWLYLAGVIDIGTRKLVGWAMGDEMKKSLVLSALEMAVKRQCPDRGLIHHSDRGSQYASKAYRRRLCRYGMKASMSKKGDCWDNAVMESFFHTLKVEHIYHQHFRTRSEAMSSIFEWIEVFYNRHRIHSSLGFVSPECYEQKLFLKCA
jgi:putative transposase